MSDKIHQRALTAPVGRFEFRDADDGDGLTLSGWITRFGEPNVISDWLGEYVEEIDPSAFDRSLEQRGPAKVRMQYDHGHDSMFGSLPVGVWESIEPRKDGLWGEGRILDSWHTIPLRAAIEVGAVDGMSFRFRVIEESWRQASKPGELDHRTLKEVSLLEAGPVVYPAVEGTSVALRSKALDLWRSTFVRDPDPDPVPAPEPEPVPAVVEPTPVERADIARVSLAELKWFLRQHAA